MKPQVRDGASQVLQTMLRVRTVPGMLDRLDRAFNHKNNRVRQSVNELIKGHVQQHGLADMSSRDVDKELVPRLVVALSDSQLPVRSASQDALAVLYSCMGEELHTMLTRHSIRPAQMRELTSRFEKAGGPVGRIDTETSKYVPGFYFPQAAAPCSRQQASAASACSCGRVMWTCRLTVHSIVC